MCMICPACGAIAEYNAYYDRATCTRCAWESEKMEILLSPKSETGKVSKKNDFHKMMYALGAVSQG